jgi:hypothetical protein
MSKLWKTKVNITLDAVYYRDKCPDKDWTKDVLQRVSPLSRSNKLVDMIKKNSYTIADIECTQIKTSADIPAGWHTAVPFGHTTQTVENIIKIASAVQRKALEKVHHWIQRRFRNGAMVQWGSEDTLGDTDLTTKEIEQLAENIGRVVAQDLLKDE